MYLTPHVGGFEKALSMPAKEALDIADQLMQKDDINSYRSSLHIWSSSLGLFSQGGKIPDKPEPPDWMEDTDDGW